MLALRSPSQEVVGGAKKCDTTVMRPRLWREVLKCGVTGGVGILMWNVNLLRRSEETSVTGRIKSQESKDGKRMVGS